MYQKEKRPGWTIFLDWTFRSRRRASALHWASACRHAYRVAPEKVASLVKHAQVRRRRETGSVAPGKIGGHKPKSIACEHRAWLLSRMTEQDFTLRELVAELAARGLKVD